MKKQLLAAAAALAFAAGANAASVVGLGGPAPYFSSYTLTFAGLSNVTGDVDLAGGTTAATVSLVSGMGVLFDSDAADGFTFSNVAGGTYQLLFQGFGTSVGAFGGSYAVTAVPEPETYAMMLAGLGMLGFMAARRRQG